MDKNGLYHYGVPGMKWGIRRYQNKDGSLTSKGKKRQAKLESELAKLTGKTADKTESASSTSSSSSKKKISEMTNEEIQAKIERLSLEKKLSDLMATPTKDMKTNDKHNEKIKKITGDIFESSARNIGSQTMTYVMGKMVNSVAGEEIVNPKKGQKDK